MRRPHGYDEMDDASALVVSGDAHAMLHPWDWDDETAQELADELQVKLDKKKPLGFAPWPDAHV